MADDTLPMRVMLQDVLVEAGYEVTTAVDGGEAWELLQTDGQNFDLLILDLLMPKMTGFEIIEKIPELKQGHKKVIVVTGIFKSNREVLRLKELGASGYITKSALVDEILFRVNQVFYLGQNNTRQWPRILLSLPVDYRVKGQQVSNYSSNFSAGGLYIRTIDPASTDQRIEIKFMIPDFNQQVEIKGRVVWNNEYDTHGRKASLPGMGVEFTDLDPQTRETLRQFVEKKLATEPVWFDKKPS